MMRWLDMPPVWLLAFLAAALVLPGPGFGAWSGWAGGLMLAAAAALFALALVEFARARTTIVPGNQPDAMINRGIYRLSRNPIYLADALILAGLVLWYGAVPGLIALPVFVWLIQSRFIAREELILSAAFGDAYAQYCSTVRRWI
jgi:protein-S-isoprenylcysteine O-methyltransferase Ste14